MTRWKAYVSQAVHNGLHPYQIFALLILVGLLLAPPQLLFRTVNWWMGVPFGNKVAIMACGVGIVLGLGKIAYDERKQQREDRDKFFELFRRVSIEKLKPNVVEELKEKFFSGQDIDRNCLRYTACGFDAERRDALRPLRRLMKRPAERFCCCQIVAGRQQGKTLLLARLADEVACRSKHVYWCSSAYSRDILIHASKIKRYLRQLPGLWAPRVYLFLDDVVNPEEDIKGVRALEQEAEDFAAALWGMKVTIVASGVHEVFRHAQARSFLLTLDDADVQAIVSKWREHDVLRKEVADAFLLESRSRKLHRRRLFALLALLYERAASEPVHHFMRRFNDEYEQYIRDPDHQPEKNLEPVAACELVHVAVPVRVITKLDHGFRMDHSVVTTSAWNKDEDDRVYQMGGPLLARWLLLKKCAKASFDQLEDPYTALLAAAFSISGFGHYASERTFPALLFHNLARGVNEDIFAGSGQAVARALFKEFGSKVTEFYQKKIKPAGNVSELLTWGRMFQSVRVWNFAAEAYEEARKNVGSKTPVLERFRLITGLADLPGKAFRLRALPIARQLFRELVSEGPGIERLRAAVLHVCCELLDGVGQTFRAVGLWNVYYKRRLVEPDTLLYMKLGEMYERLGNNYLQRAEHAFANSVASARARPADFQSELNAMQRYATFLADHARSGLTPPQPVFRRALKLARKQRLVWEPVVCAWAEYQESVGNYAHACRHFEHAVRSYQDRRMVSSHAWQGLATLLREHSGEVGGDPSQHMARIEQLCEEVIADDFADWRSKQCASHIRGFLVGKPPVAYEYRGRRRPDTEEATQILDKAFESPPGLRDDPAMKTRQDALTHRAFKDVYVQALHMYLAEHRDVVRHTDEKARELTLLQETHGRRAVDGLPREDTPGDKVMQHVLLTRDWLAFFLYHDKPKYFPNQKDASVKEAEEIYAANIHDLEDYGWGPPRDGADATQPWEKAYKLYLHYATFRRYHAPGDESKLAELCGVFANCLPAARLSRRDRDEARKRFLELAGYLWHRAGEMQRSHISTDNWRGAFKLVQCVLAMDRAWLLRFPKDSEVAQRLERAMLSLKSFRREVQAALSAA